MLINCIHLERNKQNLPGTFRPGIRYRSKTPLGQSLETREPSFCTTEKYCVCADTSSRLTLEKIKAKVRFNILTTIFPAVKHLKARAALSSAILKHAAKAQNLAAQDELSKETVIEELRQLIAITTFTTDEDRTKIMTTDLMEDMWLAIIVGTQLYADLQTALGTKRRRRYGITEPAADQEARALRVSKMKCLYKNFFSADSFDPAYCQIPQVSPQTLVILPNYITINIRCFSGTLFPISLARQMMTLDGKKEIRETKGVSVVTQRLVCAGKEPTGVLVDEKTLEQYGSVDQDTISLLSNTRF
ncbi:hypothetical protein BKA65DRAFT_581397 [Rhexocercosporidium sp. MPI-PUGE-AT-0058]|nr:hypothetical protein BKA65DRAFT_581397 [Rhexocercosporidium sp. MPI-PUGE-AT-0058]